MSTDGSSTRAAGRSFVRCAVESELVSEPMAGTAPEARAWIAVEQSGPWGRQALSESHLPPDFGAKLAFDAHGTGVTPLLIRRPGKHADDHHSPATRSVWVAFTAPGRAWMRHLTVHDLDEVHALDLAAIGQGVEPTVGTRDDAPLLLVCTNSKRDQCCAIDGLPAAADASVAFPGRVWECSHLGGHRFAATALALPHGFVHGRLDGESATRVLLAGERGKVPVGTLRGRTCWPTAAQAAEIHVRQAEGLDRVDDVLTVELDEQPDDDRGTSWVAHVGLQGGTSREVLVRSVVDETVLRPESCVKDAVPLKRYAVGPVPPTR